MNMNVIIICLFIVVCVHGDKQILNYNEIVCQVKCIEHYNETLPTYDICKEKCNNFTNIIEKGNVSDRLSDPELHCVTQHFLTVAWQPWIVSNSKQIIYLLQLRNKTENLIATITTKEFNATFKELTPHTVYQIQIWGVQKLAEVVNSTSKSIVWGPRVSSWITTFADNFTPQPVINLSLKNLEYSNSKFIATVLWTPNIEYPSCYYDLVCYNSDGREDYQQNEYNQLAMPFETQFTDLEFDSNYSVQIMSRGEIWEQESSSVTMYFMTPTCLKAVGNLSICTPDQPTGLSAEETTVYVIPSSHVTYYDVIITWDRPQYIPDYYLVMLHIIKSRNGENTQLNTTVFGNATKAVFKKIDIGFRYLVKMTAFSAAGSSEPAMLQRHIPPTVIADSPKYFWVLTIVGITVILFLAIVGVGFYVYHRHAKKKRYEKRCKYFEELDNKTSKSIDCITSGTGLILEDSQQEPDKWELLPEKLILQSVLGEGAFGLVRRAWLRDDSGNASTEVAVKMLKDAPSSEQTRQFMHEIEIMKTVGAHPHLVSLIGCCSRSNPSRCSNMMLVVEFCALGDLQNYLRNVWERMTSPPEPTLQYADIISPNSSEGSTNLIINKLYDLEVDLVENCLSATDLISFAKQIAVGMEFLSSMKVLHRDLAARNVLVCADKTVKIADFGLSRDVYKENMYRKSGNGKLPIRWMALESLTHQIYTTQSDVWSFGILLWEIVTLGGNPYPSVPTNMLLKFLKSGFRMERPTNCGQELYSLMLSCWKVRPKDRPTFTELRRSLDALLESITTAKYLDLDVLTSTEFASFRIPIKDTLSISIKTKNRSSEVISDRYVHPILLNNVKNSSGNTDIPIIIK